MSVTDDCIDSMTQALNYFKEHGALSPAIQR